MTNKLNKKQVAMVRDFLEENTTFIDNGDCYIFNKLTRNPHTAYNDFFILTAMVSKGNIKDFNNNLFDVAINIDPSEKAEQYDYSKIRDTRQWRLEYRLTKGKKIVMQQYNIFKQELLELWRYIYHTLEEERRLKS